MLTSINTGAFAKIKDNKVILKLIKDGGFEAYDFSMTFFCSDKDLIDEKSLIYAENYLDLAKELREYADSIGLICNQCHAPFADCREPNIEKLNYYIKRSIEVAKILGAKIIVVHPLNYKTPEYNSVYYKEFEPIAKDLGTKIALENMWDWKDGEPFACPCACTMPDNFLKHLSLVNEEIFVACVDIGHAEMIPQTSACELIESLGKYVQCLHIHDNDKIGDYHRTPFEGIIDYEKVGHSLKKIGYSGDLTLEVTDFTKIMPEKFYLEHVKYLSKVTHFLKELIK